MITTFSAALIMFIIFLLLVAMGAIIFFTNSRDLSARWFALLIFTASLGAFSYFIEYPTYYLLSDRFHLTHFKALGYTNMVVGVFASSALFYFPYTCVIFGIHYSKLLRLNANRNKVISILLLVPPALMYLFFDCFTYPYPKNFFLFLSIWATPYFVFTHILLIRSFLISKDRQIKLQRLLVCIILIPPILLFNITEYLLRYFGIELKDISYYIFVPEFVIFLYFAVKYSVLGVKLKFEKHRVESSMRFLTYSASMLNHSLKNEVTKISLTARNIQTSVQKSGYLIDNFDEDIRLIKDASRHMLKMINKIKLQTQEITLQQEFHNISNIVNKVLELNRPLLEPKNINISLNLEYDVLVYCDKTHVTEVLNNIIKNALEALDHDGSIEISTIKEGKRALIIVKDNGIGIPPGILPHIIEPFFSTKNNNVNFGLGLSYCYNIMQQHRGYLNIKSKISKGTIVTLSFPKSKYL